jgi:hypothetical protein
LSDDLELRFSSGEQTGVVFSAVLEEWFKGEVRYGPVTGRSAEVRGEIGGRVQP